MLEADEGRGREHRPPAPVCPAGSRGWVPRRRRFIDHDSHPILLRFAKPRGFRGSASSVCLIIARGNAPVKPYREPSEPSARCSQATNPNTSTNTAV